MKELTATLETIKELQPKMVGAMMRLQFDPAIQKELSDIDLKAMK
jgi:hypothetical protein